MGRLVEDPKNLTPALKKRVSAICHEEHGAGSERIAIMVCYVSVTCSLQILLRMGEPELSIEIPAVGCRSYSSRPNALVGKRDNVSSLGFENRNEQGGTHSSWVRADARSTRRRMLE